MRLIFAPIHGVTLAYYRNLHANIIGGVDEYYAPFIVTTDERQSSARLFDDVRCEYNDPGIDLMPQLLSNDGADFKTYARTLVELGYKTINWNIGCPFPVVTKKLRGSGILPYPEKVKKFLDEACSDDSYKVNVKMRLGYDDLDEGIEVMKVLNQYPLEGVTIHGRTGIQRYEGTVDLDAFDILYKQCVHEVTYNGDIYTISDFEKVKNRYSDINDFMLGRGILRNPMLPALIHGADWTESEMLDKFAAFHEGFLNHFKSRQSTEKALIAKMKSFWTFSHDLVDPNQEYIHDLRRSQTEVEYLRIVDAILTKNSIVFKE